ncbi:MAG: hypothetical protein P8Z30_20435, partial [Acidobacteriota bacterium]
ASDSNVDWNQALPEVRKFADLHGLKTLKIDTYSMTDPAAVVPQGKIWDCQKPSTEDAGQWVVVSSNMIMDAHNCTWLMQYPHERLAGGSMWAVHLPSVIPPAGSQGGPPPASAQKHFLGYPGDMRAFFLNLYYHPEQLPRVCAELEAQFWKQYRKR